MTAKEDKEKEKSNTANCGNESQTNQTAQTNQAESSGELKPEETAGEVVDSAEDLRQQLENMSDRYLRLMAEFDNFKKRVSRDYERLVESANERLIIELIEVRENFERALRTAETAQEKGTFFDGVKLIFSKFTEILKKNGLENFAEAGEPFDPQIHDALLKTPDEKIQEDHITEVFEKGYRLKNKVVKHAKVIVSSGMPELTPDEN